jgi:hypothetical protein
VFDLRERTGHTTENVGAELARRLLTIPETPTRLPTIRDLARAHGTSLATVHAAMNRLIDSGAIEVDTRGRLGAFLVSRSPGRLWAAAEGSPLVMSLPLASSPRYEALATALKQQLTQAGLDVFLIFVRGSRQRLQAVRDGRCHLAVMSSFAAGELCGPGEVVVLELAHHSYNTGHRVFYSGSNETSHPLRVIVDPHSADQQLLTALEFDAAVAEFIPAMGVQITRLLEKGQADAAVWTVDEMEVKRPRGILDRALRPKTRAVVGDRDTRAALVCRADMAPVLRPVTAAIDRIAVTQVQTDVIAGRIVPEY